MGIIFDLDETLADTSIAIKVLEKEKWKKAEKFIPEFKLYAGMRELLDFLRLNGINYGVVSNSPRDYCKKVLDHLKVDCHCIVAKEDGKDKPSPEPTEIALDMLSLTAKDAVALGDKGKDIESAKKAGVVSVGCLWGTREEKKLRAAGPEYIISHPLQLVPILREYFKLDGGS